jgi:hypothetical protein
VLASIALASPARAAEGKSLSDESPSFYVYGSPLFFGVPLGEDDVTDVIDFSYQWGLGLGGMFAVGDERNVGIGIGFGFEHNPATLDEDLDAACGALGGSCSIHNFRLMPELRIGGLWDQLYVYGFASPALGLVYTSFNRPLIGDNDDTDVGFSFGFGGGVQYVVYEGLFVGGDLGFDIGAYTNDEVDIGDDDYGVYLLDLKALVGYYF